MIERRHRRRILTLKNFAIFVVAAVVILAALNIASEMRAPRGNEYGRLAKRELPHAPELSTRAPDVVPVSEAPPTVAPQTTLLDPGLPNAPPPRQPSQPTSPLVTTPPAGGPSIAIVGDENGIAVVTPKRKLKGGFGRE